MPRSPAKSKVDGPAAPPASSQAFDVMQAHRLVLGRSATADEIATMADSAAATLVATLVGGEAFRDVVEREDGAPIAEEPAPVSVLHWARTAFDVEASVAAPRAALLALVLRSEAMREALQTAGIAEATAAVAQLLRHDEPVAEAEADLSLEERFVRDFVGVGVSRIQDIEATGERGVRFTSNDPALIMYLEPEIVGNAPAVELTFVVGGARRRAHGALYIAYEDSFSEDRKIALTPKGRRRYSALIFGPASIGNLRWDPDDAATEAMLVSVIARPVGLDELTESAPDALPELVSAFAGPAYERSAKLFDLSATWTRTLYGHGDFTREDYAEWILENEPAPNVARSVWKRRLEDLTARPLISVLVPTYETDAALLRETIESVLDQVYPNWELCIADDASRAPHVREVLESYAGQDDRIKVVFRKTNGHISQASNSALELATGEWLALLDHDDLLTPDALLCVAEEIAAHPDVQFIYSDEDKLDSRGVRFDPFFKPQFSPELLRSQNYLNHLSVHRTANLRAVGGWRKGFEGSQDYDINLRTLETLDRSAVRHIPKVLYHWRAIEGSTAKGGQEKSYAFMAGFNAIEEHLQRLRWNGHVEEIPGLPFYRVRYGVPDPAPLVSLIIPTRDRADLVEMCVRSILEKTEYKPYEILIVDNGSVEEKTFTLFAELTADPRVRIVDDPGPFNYSRINNGAVAQSRGAIVGLVNNDIEVISGDWMRELVSWAAQPRIGCVGAKLYYPNDTIQHAGVVLGLGGVAGHPYKRQTRAEPGYFARAQIAHELSAVTAACLFVRREVYDEVGGLDEKLQVAFNDVDFCIRVREAGYTNLFTPFAELYHHESVSRGHDIAPAARARFLSEVDFMEKRWGDILRTDPFYSPNLTLTWEDYSLKEAS